MSGHIISGVVDHLTCCACGAANGAAGRLEAAVVRSNVRHFRDEQFAVWRCEGCGSIHTRDRVDLAHYYEDYPFRRQRLNWMVRRVYGLLLRRLRRAGVRRSDSVLDFGCGSGLLVEFLHSKGYARAVGYDAYTEGFGDPALLKGRYDCLFAQDVIEHVDDPIGTLRTFHGLVNAGGLIIIGTPNAAAIDLQRPERYVHSLHQPYHRHVLSKRALLAGAAELRWTLVRFYPTAYTNPRIPFLNTRFLLHYFRCFDDTVDVAFEKRPRANRRFLLSPSTYIDGLFGSFRDPRTEMFAVFRKA